MENTQPQSQCRKLCHQVQLVCGSTPSQVLQDQVLGGVKFKAPEMNRVGEIYDKLSRFLDAATQQAQAQSDQAEQPQGDTNA